MGYSHGINADCPETPSERAARIAAQYDRAIKRKRLEQRTDYNARYRATHKAAKQHGAAGGHTAADNEKGTANAAPSD